MVQIAAVLGAAATLVIMVEMLRRRQLQEKYAVLWLALGVGLVVMAIFPACWSPLAGGWASSRQATCCFSWPGWCCC